MANPRVTAEELALLLAPSQKSKYGVRMDADLRLRTVRNFWLWRRVKP